MYAAHAEQNRMETSRISLEKCLELLKEGNSDSDIFSALLTITHHVRSNNFTAGDQRIILEAVGLEFLTRLVKSNTFPPCCPADFYKSVVLSILSAWTVEPYIAQHPAVKDFLLLVNDVISPDSLYGRDLNHKSCEVYEQMCRDSEEIVSNLTKHEMGVQYLQQSQTLDLMFKYSSSSFCQNVTLCLASLSSVVRTRGESVLNLDPETFDALMKVAVDRLGQGSDIKEKAEFARILSSFLTGIATMEVTMQTDWLVKLIQVLKKLITVRMSTSGVQAILGLVGALVNTAGPQILSSECAGDTNFLKAVVARVAVEVYMLLDNIDVNNASGRYSHLDGVYKLLSNIVQFVAECGDSMDSDCIIVVYRKLVEIRDVLMEFLYSVASQEIDFPKNHIVVLSSLRVLAAMLTEITEDVTPRMLELLPFFNLLCQNVEYSGDVVMEVKNATQVALANIKSLRIDDKIKSATAVVPGTPATSFEATAAYSETMELSGGASLESEDVDQEADGGSEISDKCSNTLCAFGDLNISDSTSCETVTTCNAADNISTSLENQFSSELNDSGGSHIMTESSSSSRVTGLFTKDEKCDSIGTNENNSLPDKGETVSSDNQNNSCLPEKGETKPPDNPNRSNLPEKEEMLSQMSTTVCLNQENIDSFKTYQASVQASRVKPQPVSIRKVSFTNKSKNRHNSINDPAMLDQLEQWKPLPDDILGYLLPAYMCLLDSEEVLEVMVRRDIFQTIVSFLETSLSHYLEDKSSGYPEITTINAVSVIELVYTNYPTSAARLECFQELFEISFLSLPNLLTLPHPPPLVCLKLLEVSLSAYKLKMREDKRKSSLSRLKHSQSRLFKAAIEYISSFYEFKQRKDRPKSLVIKNNWPLVEVSWCGCVAGLCTLVRSVEELQDALAKSHMLPDFLSFLAASDGVENSAQDVQTLTDSVLSLIEAAVEGSAVLRKLVLDNQGLIIASKLGLDKLRRSLQT